MRIKVEKIYKGIFISNSKSCTCDQFTTNVLINTNIITVTNTTPNIFLTNLAEFYTGKEVVLSNGQQGRIIYVDVNFPTRPIVKSGEDIIDLIRNKELEVTELIS